MTHQLLGDPLLGHISFLGVSGTGHLPFSSCLRPFAHAVPSAWGALPASPHHASCSPPICSRITAQPAPHPSPGPFPALAHPPPVSLTEGRCGGREGSLSLALCLPGWQLQGGTSETWCEGTVAGHNSTRAAPVSLRRQGTPAPGLGWMVLAPGSCWG